MISQSSPRPLRSRRRERGQSLVEFAAVVDFGLGLRASITVTQSAREAARVASVSCATADADPDAVVQTAVDKSAGLLTTSDVAVTNCPGGPTESVTVDVSYDYHLVTPLGGLLKILTGGDVPGTITLTSGTDMRLE